METIVYFEVLEAWHYRNVGGILEKIHWNFKDHVEEYIHIFIQRGFSVQIVLIYLKMNWNEKDIEVFNGSLADLEPIRHENRASNISTVTTKKSFQQQNGMNS